MASILKVDTLQKPDGSTPTAADLGLDVAGSVVGYAYNEITANINVTTTGYVDLGLVSSIITKQANPLIVYRFNIGRAVAYPSNGIAYRIYYSTDGTNYNVYSNNDLNEIVAFHYIAGTSTETQGTVEGVAKLDMTGLPTGSTVYFKIYARSWNAGTNRAICSDGAGAQSTTEIFEIAQ